MAQLRYRYEETRSDLSHVRDRTTTLRGFYGFNWQRQQISSGMIAEREWTLLNLSSVRIELGYRPERWDDRNSFGNGAFKTEGRATGEFSLGTNESLPLVGGVFGGIEQETLQDWSYRGGVFVVWRPGDRFNARMRMEVGRRNGWVLHDQARRMTSFNAERIAPRMTLEYYFSARQQLRASMQWIGLRAKEANFYEIAPNGRLIDAEQPTVPGAQNFRSPMPFFNCVTAGKLRPCPISSWFTAAAVPSMTPLVAASTSSLAAISPSPIRISWW